MTTLLNEQELMSYGFSLEDARDVLRRFDQFRQESKMTSSEIEEERFAELRQWNSEMQHMRLDEQILDERDERMSELEELEAEGERDGHSREL
jgi:DNA-binding transcriptional MerR regulator